MSAGLGQPAHLITSRQGVEEHALGPPRIRPVHDGDGPQQHADSQGGDAHRGRQYCEVHHATWGVCARQVWGLGCMQVHCRSWA